MKYTILGFQQEKLIECGLKIDDAQLLRVIKDMYSSASMEFIIEEGKQYMWVNQRYLLEQIPILGSRRKMLSMIDKYVELGLVEKILKHDRKGQKGNYSYLRPTIKLDELTEYTPYAKVAQGLCKNSTRVMQKLHNKDTSIKDTSIKDNKDGDGNIFRDIKRKFENNGFGLITQSTSEQLIDLSNDYTDEWLLEALDIAIAQNKRNLAYVKGILKKWKAEGKNLDKPKNDPYAGVEIF